MDLSTKENSLSLAVNICSNIDATKSGDEQPIVSSYALDVVKGEYIKEDISGFKRENTKAQECNHEKKYGYT